MNTEELKAVNAEVRDPAKPAKNPTKTFAYKYLGIARRIVWAWTLIALIALVAQIALMGAGKGEIPGLAGLFAISGAIAAALVGGDKIAQAIKK